MPATGAPTIDRSSLPDSSGHFGPYGGIFVPETLMAALEELEQVYLAARDDPAFQAELRHHLAEFAGRPDAALFCRAPDAALRRREDLPQARGPAPHGRAQDQQRDRPGAPGARGWERSAIIAETGAGQHGVATAAVCAKFGLECVVYMGAVDMERQALNVFRMRLMGAEVRGVEAGQKTLKEAINEAMRDWVTNVRTTHYILGTAYGAQALPGDGPRLPPGDRGRGEGADPRARGPPAGRARRLRGRRQQRHRALLRIPRGARASG